ncbi:MAG TPA: hypothetical protein VN493_23950 [Thermoanaerobaculia bacterium]|nr:hypothetical protein [Thermoanaerobaculia bacterium]
MNDSVDLWPHRLFWMGDPRAVAIFSVKVPRDEPGPWLGMGSWRPWRQRSTSTKGLDGWLRNNEPHLRQDAFATINRFYRWQRAQEYVVRLGAIFVDIDCGRSVFDYSAKDAADVLRDLVQVGRLAQPSMLQFSGRGLWAFWLLRDEQDPGTTPFANADNRELWTSLQQRTADTIATAFPNLKLDRTAGEFTRVTRLHGSVNPAADRRVRYVLLPGPAGEPIRYSLEELAGFYGLRRPAHVRPLGESEEDRRDMELEAHRRREEKREEKRQRKEAARTGGNPRLSDLGRQGHVKLWRNRLRFLDRVRVEIHGGVIPCGRRYTMLSAYAYCYAKLTRDHSEVAGKVATIGRKFCEQPAEDLMTEAELRGITEHALGWAQNGSKITNWKLAAFAGLDPVADRKRIERLGLNLSTGPKGRNERTRERRELAREILQAAFDRGEDPPSARKFAQVLTEQGCATGRSTAHALLGDLWAELRPGNGRFSALE